MNTTRSQSSIKPGVAASPEASFAKEEEIGKDFFLEYVDVPQQPRTSRHLAPGIYQLPDDGLSSHFIWPRLCRTKVFQSFVRVPRKRGSRPQNVVPWPHSLRCSHTSLPFFVFVWRDFAVSDGKLGKDVDVAFLGNLL